jgi:hypothetical protein
MNAVYLRSLVLATIRTKYWTDVTFRYYCLKRVVIYPQTAVCQAAARPCFTLSYKAVERLG